MFDSKKWVSHLPNDRGKTKWFGKGLLSSRTVPPFQTSNPPSCSNLPEMKGADARPSQLIHKQTPKRQVWEKKKATMIGRLLRVQLFPPPKESIS